MDETASFLNPKGTKVLAAEEEKSVHQKVNVDEKECYTVLLGGNAIGDVLPPMVIFKSCDVWLGAKEDVELLKFHKRVEESLKNLASDNSNLEPSNNVPEITRQLLDDSNTDAAVNENDETRTEPSENKKESTTGTTTSITNEDHLNFGIDDFENTY
ncbi:hypothetical protein HHI36_002793 [Cryptolaemus montrouzieri]|uniref:Uncharacterized protein n=1 Tax=Cryptolaemus montrouzieri TaxID=559131 RepID=A0ABD2PBS8_9CUCU